MYMCNKAWGVYKPFENTSCRFAYPSASFSNVPGKVQPCCHKFEADSVSMQQILQHRYQLLSNPTWEGEGPLGPLGPLG